MVVYTFMALAEQRHRTLKNVCFTISTGTRKIILIIPIKCESLCVLSHLSVSLSHIHFMCDATNPLMRHNDNDGKTKRQLLRELVEMGEGTIASAAFFTGHSFGFVFHVYLCECCI